jgi:uncharacterized membrane protein
MALTISRISKLDTHHRLLVALGAALVVFVGVSHEWDMSVQLTCTWVAFAFTMLALMWISIVKAHPRELLRLSRLQDSSRLLILTFIIAAAVASLFAVVALLDSIKPENRISHTLLAVLAVSGAWGLVHTIFTLRYAHLYYGDPRQQAERPGGLEFPNETDPDYLDFAYFSFIIGMTSQTADVSIGSKRMRRTALAHGILAFGFNAIIIALTISGLSGALSPDSPSGSAASPFPADHAHTLRAAVYRPADFGTGH